MLYIVREMKQDSKVTLSAGEMQLVTDSNWILTKRIITEKAIDILGQLASCAQEVLDQSDLPFELKKIAPKISKGENYLGLPWLMLDYPRLFDNEKIFAIRTMFWWGNFFSITLHLRGYYVKAFQNKLIQNINWLKTEDFFICTNTDEWQHHFNESNYVAVKNLSQKEIETFFLGNDFIKIAKKIPLQQWNEMPLLLQQSYTGLLKILED